MSENKENIEQVFCPSASLWVLWIKAVHALEALFSNVVISEVFNASYPLLSNFFGAFLHPGECPLQHLRVLDCCH